MKRLKKLALILDAAFLFLATRVFAAATDIIPTNTTKLPGANTDRFGGVVVGYINIFLAIVGIVAVAYLIYGGFMYITSAGNEENAEQAKKIIQNSIIGLVVIILSFTIITIIVNALFGSP